MDNLLKYSVAGIGGAIALTLFFCSTGQGVLVTAAKYAGDEFQLIKFMGDMGYPKLGEWCGEFAASIITRAGGIPPYGAAIASNWRNYGTLDAMPHVGDVAVADRGVPTGALGSHVGFVTGISLKNSTFTLESGDSCNIYTTRRISDFTFHKPPDSVLSALTGDGVQAEPQSADSPPVCHSFASGTALYSFAGVHFRPRCTLPRRTLWPMRAAEFFPSSAEDDGQR